MFDSSSSVLFAGALGRNVFFNNAQFLGVTVFDHAIIPQAIFINANVTDVRFKGVNLRSALFYNANAAGADFTDATLLDANFSSADLTGVVWDNTICPDGTNRDDKGGTCIGAL